MRIGIVFSLQFNCFKYLFCNNVCSPNLNEDTKIPVHLACVMIYSKLDKQFRNIFLDEEDRGASEWKSACQVTGRW